MADGVTWTARIPHDETVERTEVEGFEQGSRCYRSWHRTRSPRLSRGSQMLDVISQIQLAYKRANRLAALLGFALGGFVPVAVYQVAHRTTWGDPGARRTALAVLVLGGLLFSAVTVYQWGRLAFGSPSKALGFLALAEITMIVSPVPWLAQVALGYLLFVNGTATACNLVLARPPKGKARSRSI